MINRVALTTASRKEIPRSVMAMKVVKSLTVVDHSIRVSEIRVNFVEVMLRNMITIIRRENWNCSVPVFILFIRTSKR